MRASGGSALRTHSKTRCRSGVATLAVACRLHPISMLSAWPRAITCTPNSARTLSAARLHASSPAFSTCRLKLVTYVCEPTMATPDRCGTAAGPKLGGSCRPTSLDSAARTERKKEVPRRASRTVRPARAPYSSTGTPCSPRLRPSEVASSSQLASSSARLDALASERGMKATMSTAPCLGCGAGWGSSDRSTSASASAVACRAASRSGSGSPTILTDERAYDASTKVSTIATRATDEARAAIFETSSAVDEEMYTAHASSGGRDMKGCNDMK
eukprot:scaffold46472_cov62-Phaeocystis_antarctica.AAC.2